MRSLLSALIMACALWPLSAVADIQWRIINRPYLQGQFNDDQGEQAFWAYCRPGSVIDVGVGANAQVGEGSGEAVMLSLTSGDETARLRGISRKTANFDKTGGTELRTSVSEDDPLFDVLATGQPITVTGSLDGSVTWNVEGLRSRVRNFLRQCR